MPSVKPFCPPVNEFFELDDGFDSSSFECQSIGSSSTSSRSIFDTPLDEKFDLNKELEELEAVHSIIKKSLHSTTLRSKTLQLHAFEHRKLLRDRAKRSDSMLTRLKNIEIEASSLLALFLPEKLDESPTEMKEPPTYSPVYSQEYVEKYVKQASESASELNKPTTTPDVYNVFAVAVIAMLIYAVCIRDPVK